MVELQDKGKELRRATRHCACLSMPREGEEKARERQQEEREEGAEEEEGGQEAYLPQTQLPVQVRKMSYTHLSAQGGRALVPILRGT